MELLDGLGQHGVERLCGLRVFGSERLQHYACEVGLGLRHVERLSLTIAAYGLLHRLGVLKLGRVARYDGLYLSALGGSEQGFVLLFVALVGPFGHESLQEPQSGDVLQERYLAAYAALVGELCASGLLGEDGRVELHTQQRPCARADERHGALVGLGRHGSHGTGGVVRSHGDDIHLPQSGLLGDVGAQLSTHRSRHDDGAEQVARQSDAVDERPVPRPRGGVEHLRGRCDGVLGVGLAREEKREEVGGEEQAVGDLQLRRVGPLHAEELEQGVDLHHLGAVHGIVVGAVGVAEEVVGHALRACVAVAHRVAHEVALAVDEPKVDPPCVDGDARHFEPHLRRLAQPGLHVLEEGWEIPIHMVAQPHLSVLKAVHKLHLELLAPALGRDGSGNDTA